MKKILLFYISLFSLLGFTQKKTNFCEDWKKEKEQLSNYDSIIKLNKFYLNKVSKSCKVEVYESIVNLYRDLRKKDSSLYYMNEGVKLAKLSKMNSKVCSFYLNIADIYVKESNIDSVVKYLNKSKRLIDKLDDKNSLSHYYSIQSSLMTKKSKKNKAYKYSDSAIQITVKLKDTSNLPNLYQNIGLKYVNNNEYEKGIEKLLISAQLKEKYNHNDIDGTYYLLGGAYDLIDNYETSKKYLNKSINASKKSGNIYVLLLVHLKFIGQLRSINKYDDALKYIDSARIYATQLKADKQIAQLDLNAGFIFLNGLKDYKKAEFYFNKANDYSSRFDKYDIMQNAQNALFDLNYKTNKLKKAYQNLKILQDIVYDSKSVKFELRYFEKSAKYHQKTGNYKKALENNIEFHRIQDSLFDVDKVTKIAELEKQYDTQNKELKIAELNEAKKAQELLTQKAKTKQNLFLGFLVILGLLFLMGFWFYRKSKKQQNALAKAHKKLSEVDAVKNRLFSIIAHDLRGMLVPFQRAGKILNHHVEKENYDKVKTLSKDLQTNSQSLSNMLDNLLNWSLEQMNGYTFKKESFSLKKEFETIISNFEQHAKDKNTAITLNYNEDYTVDFDKGAFHVIFRNLIGNALKYTEQGTIKVVFNKDFNALNCSVSDTGVGIDKEKQMQLFTLDNNNSTKGTQGEKGTGLGLNLVQRFVNMHQGKISVSSKLRLGTRFDISFPIFESEKGLEDNTSISA
ncbi:ATP-binding protein [uncultured Algibacter sp.]|uniref:tetratricopeptide repeat-containing sensor histidine kinase n=1 Tax=uncultured Algibacter sp. TaxID=298659 RepID=UPI0032179BD6